MLDIKVGLTLPDFETNLTAAELSSLQVGLILGWRMMNQEPTRIASILKN